MTDRAYDLTIVALLRRIDRQALARRQLMQSIRADHGDILDRAAGDLANKDVLSADGLRRLYVAMGCQSRWFGWLESIAGWRLDKLRAVHADLDELAEAARTTPVPSCGAATTAVVFQAAADYVERFIRELEPPRD